MGQETAIQTVDAGPAEVVSVDPMMRMLESVFLNPEIPADRISLAMDMRERQLNKEAEQAFNKAFAMAMAEMPDVARSGENKHLKTRYSTLDDLIRAARPVLARHGLSLNWETGTKEQLIWVKAIVRHADGHSISTELQGARDNGKQMNALQGGGSTETYLKRYTGFSLLGLSSGDEKDDDGQNPQTSITEQQFIEITNLAEEKGIPLEVICKAHAIEHLPLLPASSFTSVISRLNKTEAAK